MEDLVRKLKQKPEHVRRRIAVGTSAGITALVAIVWVTAMTASGTFALNSNPSAAKKAPSTDAFALDGTNVKSNLSQLTAAVDAATGATSTEPSLTIVDGTTTSSIAPAKQPSGNNTSATVLPF